MKLTEIKRNFGVPEAVISFGDVGIGPNQGNNRSRKK